MNYQIKAGTFVAFTEGEYSDFNIPAHVVFRKDCNLEEALKDWEKLIKKQPSYGKSTYFSSNQDSFIAWLQAEQIVIPADVREIHLGSYGEVTVGNTTVIPS